jgi:hypothetical protein
MIVRRPQQEPQFLIDTCGVWVFLGPKAPLAAR